MKELGVKVLNRIESLISEIQKKPSRKDKRATRRITDKQQENPVQQKTEHGEYLRKLSYSFVEKREKVEQKLKQQVYKEAQQFQPFKVTNKATKAILSRKNIKPIHERLDQILGNKWSKIQRYKRESFVKQMQESLPYNQSVMDNSTNNSHSKPRYIEIEQLRQEIDDKNQNRIKKMHFLQLNHVKKQLYNGIPSIAVSSRSLSKVYNQKKKLSDNVFQRLSQDNIDRNRRKIQLTKKRQMQEGGYSPFLCQKSRTLIHQGKVKRQEIHLDRSVDSLSHKKCKQPPAWMSNQKNSKKELSIVNPQTFNRKAEKSQEKQMGKISKIQKANLSKSNIKQAKSVKLPEQKPTDQKTKNKQIELDTNSKTRKSQVKLKTFQASKTPEKTTGKKRKVEENKKSVESTTAKRDLSFQKP